jgi:hypothetical protein
VILLVDEGRRRTLCLNSEEGPSLKKLLLARDQATEEVEADVLLARDAGREGKGREQMLHEELRAVTETVSSQASSWHERPFLKLGVIGLLPNY